MSFDFVRKMSLRRQILWGTQLFTAVVSLLVGVVLFALSDSYIRTTTLRSVEFNLQQMAASVQTDLDTARSLLNWASTDSTLRRYLTAGQMNGLLTTSAYETFSDRYLSSRLQTRIVRFFVTNGENRFLQQGSLTSSAGLNADTVALFDGPENTLTFAEDPLLPSHPTCLVLRREIRPDSEKSYTGWIYLGLDTAVITGAADRYIMPDGGVLYWRMGDQVWRLDGRLLTLVKNGLALEPCDVSGMASPATNVSRITRNGRSFLGVGVPLQGWDAELIQLFPESTFLNQRMVYLLLIGLGILLLWAMSALLVRWLDAVITQPVAALRHRIDEISEGNFTIDHTIEWSNELGDIGRGINHLAGNVEGLLARRLEDQKRKQDLEYQMLQTEINPHFIYNTLNSIRWMATIQNATGIAEMVTAFARLTKSISKSTEKLVPLQDELGLLNDYFTIQQYRYGGDIQIEVAHIDDEAICRDCMIPRFTLQPLAENAIFHGLEPKGGFGSVLLEIRISPGDGDVLVTMTDDGVGMPPEQVARLLDPPENQAAAQDKIRHVGLWNVHRRLQYSFGSSYGLEIESEPGVGTAVTIRLPYRKHKEGGQDHAADPTG